MRIFKILIGILIIILVFLFVGILVIINSNLLVEQFNHKDEAIYYKSLNIIPIVDKRDSINFMSWNIKFGGGRIDFFFDCYGDRVIMKEDEVITHLKKIADKIRKENPDIIYLQEVDIDSKRAADIDMVQWILDHTDLNYAVYASQWKVNHLPKHGLGNINSGNAILSKWKLSNAERIALPLLDFQDPITKFFYLRRNLLIADVELNQKKYLKLINTHLSAYVKDNTRKIQIDSLYNYVNNYSKSNVLVFGGDFNTLPPGTKNVKNFDDSVCEEDDFVMDDYTKELNYLTRFYNQFYEIIPHEDYLKNEKKYYSHTVNGQGYWNRRLDYLFSNNRWINGLVHQNKDSGGIETMPLSDHAPITGTLVLSDN